MHTSTSTFSVGAILALALACGESSVEQTAETTGLPLAEATFADGRSMRRAGTLTYYGDALRLETPARAAVGTPTDVYVTTYHGGCSRSDTTVSAVQGLRATVVPYQKVPTDPNVVCTAALKLERRLVRLTFLAPGSAVLRVVGRAEPGWRLVAVERRIAVE